MEKIIQCFLAMVTFIQIHSISLGSYSASLQCNNNNVAFNKHHKSTTMSCSVSPKWRVVIFFNFKLCVWKLLIKFAFTYQNIFWVNLLQNMPKVNYFITQVVDVQVTKEWISQVYAFKSLETIKRIAGW